MENLSINSIPWIEKYRPHNIEDLILDNQIVEQIKFFVKNIENLHLIITGSPGIGKTSTVRCIAKKTLGDNMLNGYLELNAAEDRGVRTISTLIPAFCRRIVNFTEQKIILFDEADSMTTKCQLDINEMIKLYGKKTKFIFTCNDSSKIIEDIQSVCRIVKYKRLSDDQIYHYMGKICEMENVKFDKDGLMTICYIAAGDMRKGINSLQLTSYTYGLINKINVLKICKVPDPEDINKIIILCNKLDLVGAHSNIENLIDNGYYYLDIVTAFSYVLSKSDIDETLKIKLIDIVNQTQIIISVGLRTRVQLSALISRLIKVYSAQA